jgi:hypothetical protein
VKRLAKTPYGLALELGTLTGDSIRRVRLAE